LEAAVDSSVAFTLGKYEIIGLLGQGGNAVVYKGYHREIDRFLAVKVLRPDYRVDPKFVERFRLEARVIARLQHPHIVPLYDYGNENDVWYLATAYIQGGSLAEVVEKGALPLRQTDKILREVVSALDYAHRNGVIHRDIKPSNILLDTEGHALLADFGIVKIAGTGTTLTGTGNVLGTPAYIAPEQGQGHPIDYRADLYSLGVVAFEMLTGVRPFGGRTPVEAIIEHVNAPVPSVTRLRPALPYALEATMQRVMAKHPDMRYQTAVDFYEDFSRACHSDPSVVELRLGLMPKVETAVHPVIQVTGEVQAPPSTIIFADPHPQTPALDSPVASDEAAPMLTPGILQRRGLRLAALALAVVVGLALVRMSIGRVTTFGSVRYSAGAIAGDTVRLDVQALPAPPDGEAYVAWLHNTGDGSTAMLGALTVDESGMASLSYTDPDGRILPALFDQIIITQETESRAPSAGTVRYRGQLPTALSVALTEILYKSNQLPEGAAGRVATYGPAGVPLNSLLDGVLLEATFGQLHSGLAADAPNAGAMYIHAEHTINIMRGTRDDHNGNGRGENPGRKIGVPFFLDHMDALFNAAINAPDTPPDAANAMLWLPICTQNMRTWMNRVISLEFELLAATDIEVVTPQKTESTVLATWMLEGRDLNENGQVEMVEGECGLQQVTATLQGIAVIPIVAG
jgi:tRNA A-37 threonylcarbamoyl transferase component Bud32